MKSIAFFNNKGGVSKTTTVLNIAYILGEVYGRKVLVVDCDGQQNASRFLADELTEVGVEKTLITAAVSPREALSTTRYEHIDVLTSTRDAVDGAAETKSLPPLSEGQELQGEYKVTEGETEPPKRYTEAELLAAMELAGQKLEDEEARTLMKLQKKGLGTDATRGPILKSLFDKEYLAKKGKSIYPTELGMYLIKCLPVKELKSAAYTGELEKQLNNISLGKSSYDKYIAFIKQKTAEWYKVIAESEGGKFSSSAEQQLICPFCGKPLIKLDWGYSCTGYKDGCKFHVNKKIAGKSITENQVIMLCKSGRTAIIKGFKAKSGSTFDAYLTVNKEKQEVSFQFPDKKK